MPLGGSGWTEWSFGLSHIMINSLIPNFQNWTHTLQTLQMQHLTRYRNAAKCSTWPIMEILQNTAHDPLWKCCKRQHWTHYGNAAKGNTWPIMEMLQKATLDLLRKCYKMWLCYKTHRLSNCGSATKVSIWPTMKMLQKAALKPLWKHSSGAVWESRWTSWAVRPNEPSGFRGRKDLLHHASALVTTCP